MSEKAKIYAGILAGGVGSRMGSTAMPKQFLPIGGRPVIVHTLEKFLMNPRFERVYIAVVRSYMGHMQSLLEKTSGELAKKVVIVEGGADRNSSIVNIISDIRKSDLSDSSILITHDAVRPFVSARIIDENIDAALEAGATDTVVPAYDTIIRSLDKKRISEVPNRAELFYGQTPQGFIISWFEQDFAKLNDAQRAQLTDASRIFADAGREVRLVEGDPYNMKISTQFDLKLAEAIISQGKAEG